VRTGTIVLIVSCGAVLGILLFLPGCRTALRKHRAEASAYSAVACGDCGGLNTALHWSRHSAKYVCRDRKLCQETRAFKQLLGSMPLQGTSCPVPGVTSVQQHTTEVHHGKVNMDRSTVGLSDRRARQARQ
jgi:hypothetical protein